MSNEIIKNSEIPHQELVNLYNSACENLKIECDRNVLLRSENMCLHKKLLDKNRVLGYLMKEIKKAID